MATRQALRGLITLITLVALCFGLAVSAPAAAAPTLVSPATGANVPGTSVAFTWNTVSARGVYIVGVWPTPDKSHGGRLFAGTEEVAPTTTKVVDGFANDGQIWYWLVTAGNVNSEMRYFLNGATTPPDVPVVTAPADGAVIAGDTVSFSWNAGPRATDYRLQIAFDPGFTDLALDAFAGGPFTTFNINGFPNDATVPWYWRVAAVNPVGSSAFSATRTFVNGVPPSAAPVLTGPANGSNVPGDTIPFRWNDVPGTDNFRLVLATDSAFSNVVFDQWIGPFIGTDMSPFPDDGQQYFWKVQGGNPAGAGPFSATFSVVNGPSAPPAVPALGAPADGANVGGTVITFSWEFAAHALDYHYTIATDSAFTNIVAEGNAGNTNSVDVNAFLDIGKQYFWRVAAINPLGSSAPSATRSFVNGPSAVPAAPALVSPANGANAGGTTIAFRWNAAARADNYRIMIAKDSGFTSLAFDDWVGNVTGFDFTALDDGQQYFWRVTARNVLGTGPASAVSSVVNGPSAPPAVPTLVSPADAANAGGTTITFRWNAAARATNYRLTVAFDSAFTQISFDSTVGNVQSFDVTTAPDDGTKFFWRVTAINAAGSSAPSAARSVVNGPSTPPATPTLVSPADGANVAGSVLPLQWNAVARATSYRLTVAFDSAFTQISFDGALGNFTGANFGVFDDGTRYFWRISAINAAGESAPSAARSVVNGPSALPAATTLVSPVDGANVAGAVVPLQWSPAARANDYRLTVALDSAFTQIVVDGLTGNFIGINFDGLADDGTRYFWRVTAVNALGSSAPSATRSFVNGSPVLPGTLTLVSPADGANVGGTTIPFRWNVVAHTNNYRLTVAFDSAFTQIAFDEALGNFTGVDLGVPDDGTLFFWRVTAINAVGSSTSAVRSVVNGPSAVPDATTLVSPADGANVAGAVVPFRWNVAARANDYRLTIAFDTAFTQVGFDGLVGNTNGIDFPNFADDGTRYFWRVTPRNSLGESAPSATRSVVNGSAVLPATPTPVSPADGANIAGTVLSFGWNAVAHTNNYRLTVAFDSAFTQIAFDQALGNILALDLGGFADDGTRYFWRVSAINGVGESAPSATRSVVNGLAVLPATPALVSPADGANVAGTVIPLRWSSVAHTNNYRLIIAIDSAFTQIVFDAQLGNALGLDIGVADDGTQYFWRVSAINGVGESAPSAGRSVVNGPSAVPGPVTLMLPAEGQTAPGTKVLFEWSQAQRSNNYRFTLAYDSQFTVLAFDASLGNSLAAFVPGLPDDGTRLYWRVTPSNPLGSGPVSATGSFFNGLNLACSPAIGTGLGLLVPRPHVDTCLDGVSAMYFLRDVSRRAGNGPPAQAQMAANASIDTYLQDSTLAQDPDNTWDASTQAAAIDAHVNAARVYDYHLGRLGLNGFDNAGSSMHNIMDSTDPFTCPNNAFWDGAKVNFCANIGIISFAAALDVVAHEWGHAVTDHHSGLIHTMESGALNESFSDWIGIATEQANGGTNWTMGESVVLVRDLANPPALQQPDTYGGLFWLDTTTCAPGPENDFCGVHQNTGVPNKMFYLLSVGGTHNGVAVQGITIDKAMRIGFEANRNDWLPDTTMAQARDGMVAAAQRIYGEFSNEQTQVRNAWAAVMVGSVPPVAAPVPAQTVASGGVVTLTGTATDQDGTVASYRWMQAAGPTVRLANPDTNSTSFVAPTLANEAVLTFRLVVTDDAGEVGSQTVNVTVSAKRRR